MTRAGSIMPEMARPRPNSRPASKLVNNFMAISPLQQMMSDEDGDKAGRHEGEGGDDGSH